VTKTASRTPLLHYSRWRTRCQMPRNKMGGLPALRGGRAAPAIVFRHHTGHAQRVVSSLGVFKVLNPTWPPAAQQCAGQGPNRMCHGRVSTRRVLKPATKIGMRLPTARGGETRSLSHALMVLGAPTQWRSLFDSVTDTDSVKDVKGPSLPYTRACAVVPRLPEPYSGDASLYVVCMLRGMAFAGDFRVHPHRYFCYNFFFSNTSTQESTGRRRMQAPTLAPCSPLARPAP